MSAQDLSAPGELNALLGRGAGYVGKLTFEGRVRIDGRFEGEVFSEGTLILGDGAVLDAKVEVGTLIVLSGEVRGHVTARDLVEVHAEGRVHADVVTPQIFIDRGAVFTGRCTMPGSDTDAPRENLDATETPKESSTEERSGQ
ncbi:MAG: polymer-forming cytoskeletal protein [Myxococcota bacterium]